MATSTDDEPKFYNAAFDHYSSMSSFDRIYFITDNFDALSYLTDPPNWPFIPLSGNIGYNEWTSTNLGPGDVHDPASLRIDDPTVLPVSFPTAAVSIAPINA